MSKMSKLKAPLALGRLSPTEVMGKRRQGLPRMGRWPKRIKAAFQPVSFMQEASCKARRASKRAAEERDNISADEVISKRVRHVGPCKTIISTLQSQLICEITALTEEMSRLKISDDNKPQSLRKRRNQDMPDPPKEFCSRAEIVAKVDALKSLKRARTAGDSANESNPTKQTSSMSPSPRPSAAPTQVDRLGGVVERGNGCSLDFTVNPFLKEMQTEPNCTKFGKELPQSTDSPSSKEGSEASGDEAFHIPSNSQKEGIEIPWPEDDEEMYKLFFGDEEDDEDDAALTNNNDNSLVTGDGNTDLAFEAWLKERDQKGEAATEQWNPSCVEPVFLGCTGFPVFTVGKRK